MKREKKPTISDLLAAIGRLEERIEVCNAFCEQILDEVVPLGLAIDMIVEETPSTAS